MGWWHWLLVVPVALAALLFALGPVLIRFIMSQKAEPEFKTLDTESGELTADVYEYFASTIETLGEDGFRLACFLQMPDQTPVIRACLALLVNEMQRDAAMVMAMYSQDDNRTRLETLYVEFATEFVDGFEIDTSNTAQLGSFPAFPVKRTNAFPEISDPRRLYEVHRALCARWASGDKKPILSDEELPADIARGMVKELRRLVGVGYFWLDAAGACYRPTWKGAFLMTWRLCWPVTTIRKANRAKHNARLLREIGA
jgi:hypothetical protein